MSNEPNRKITLPTGGGIFPDLAKRVKLIFRLLADPRVSPLVKLLPIGSAIYLVFPDLAPGPIDDAAIIWLATYLFVELCPPDIVEEHMQALEGKNAGGGSDESTPPVHEEDIIEGEYREDK
jgi:hypothetical protein